MLTTLHSFHFLWGIMEDYTLLLPPEVRHDHVICCTQ